jgi:hypothetical protein
MFNWILEKFKSVFRRRKIQRDDPWLSSPHGQIFLNARREADKLIEQYRRAQ